MSNWAAGAQSGNSRSANRSDAPAALLAAFISVVAIAYVMQHGILGGVGIAMAFTGFIAFGEMFRIQLPNERVAAPVASAFAVAYALVIQFGSSSQDYGVAQAVVVAAAGACIGAVSSALLGQFRQGAGPTLQVEEIVRRILTTFAVAAVFRPVAAFMLHRGYVVYGQAGQETQHGLLLALVMLVAAVLGTMADVILVGLARSTRQNAPLDRTLKDEFRESLPIGVPTTSSAVLMALAAPWMSWWALVIFAMPVLLSQFAFSRYARVVSTNESTIRALARVTELGGYTELQHADRVADLSRQVGLQLGLSSKQQLALERAALMHDIGQLSLAEAIPGGRPAPGSPFIPGGATILLELEQQHDLAKKGAAVIRDTKFLDDVADIVERQVDPYRPRGGSLDPTLPLASRIIKVANAYDDLVGGSLEADRRLQAVARLREGAGHEYDPAVVDVLARISQPRLS
ncbi:MAG: HD domain-containing phosphohydrolase [Actinomycetes bacterium]